MFIMPSSKRPTAVLLILSMVFLYTGPAFGQSKDKEKDGYNEFSTEGKGSMDQDEPDPPYEYEVDLSKSDSWADCHLLGKRDAGDLSTSGSWAGGFAGGILLGLIGTGIAVLAQTKSEPPTKNMFELEESSGECRYAYVEAFNDESASKKRRAALTGGLVGTAVLVVILVAANGSN